MRLLLLLPLPTCRCLLLWAVACGAMASATQACSRVLLMLLLPPATPLPAGFMHQQLIEVLAYAMLLTVRQRWQ